jgi:hypothetical protein
MPKHAPKKRSLVGFLADPDLKEQLRQFGEKHEINLSELIRELTQFDPYFLEIIMGYSKRHKMPFSLVIQNMLIKRFAEEAAEDEFHGKPQTRILPEFAHTKDGFITGGELFNRLKDMELNRLRSESKTKPKQVSIENWG